MQRFKEFYSLQVLHSEGTLVSLAQGILNILTPTAWAPPPTTASQSAGGGQTGGDTGPARSATAPAAAPPVAEKRGEMSFPILIKYQFIFTHTYQY